MGKGGWHNADTRIFAEDKLETKREKTGYSLKEPSCERKEQQKVSEEKQHIMRPDGNHHPIHWPPSHTQVAEGASFQTSASLEGKINMGFLMGMMRVSKWM